jgi:hypothetical protein
MHDCRCISWRFIFNDLADACRGFTYVDRVAQEAGFVRTGLRSLTALLLGMQLRKDQTLSDWGAEELTCRIAKLCANRVCSCRCLGSTCSLPQTQGTLAVCLSRLMYCISEECHTASRAGRHKASNDLIYDSTTLPRSSKRDIDTGESGLRSGPTVWACN